MAARPATRRGSRRAAGLVPDRGHDPDRDLGFIFQDQIETGARNLWLVGTVLIVFALVLGYADRVGRHERDIDAALDARRRADRPRAVAVADPGRVAVGRDDERRPAARPERPAAARFSFLLAVPAVVASGLFELKDVISGDEHGDDAARLRAGRDRDRVLVGYAAIAWLLRYLAHHSVKLFVIYRVLLGGTVLVLVATGAIS